MTSALSGVPANLPALERAARISELAARVGFDWVCFADIRAKVTEELDELDEALALSAGTTSAEVIEEFGDLLVALVNMSRRLEIDAEAALRAASAKFERRFQYMESQASASGRALASLSAADWDRLWIDSKRSSGTAV